MKKTLINYIEEVINEKNSITNAIAYDTEFGIKIRFSNKTTESRKHYEMVCKKALELGAIIWSSDGLFETEIRFPN